MYTTLENYIILYPAVILIFALLDKRWGSFGRGLIVVLILIMTVGLWGILVNKASTGSPPDLDPIIFFFMPLLTFLGLYWVRWWAIRPMRLPLEEFAERFG
jgi:cation transporter-like permease